MMEMTYHCKYEREGRVNAIIEKIGIGQVVKESYHNGKYICITDTGITLIKNETKTILITMYVTTIKELMMVYGGMKKVPTYLHKRVDRNQSWYIQDGKTAF